MLLHFQDAAKLKTKKVVYEETFYARDSGTLEQLKELSSRRRTVEESVNGSSFITAAIAREMVGGTSRIQQDLQKLELYLPLLENLVMSVESVGDKYQILQWTTNLKIQWTSALNSSPAFSLGGPKFFRIDNLRFELGMALFVYGALLRERGLEMLCSDFVESATLFRKAAGVYEYLSQDVLPPLEPKLPPERPPEATPSMASIMRLVCLAEAQRCGIQKLIYLIEGDVNLTDASESIKSAAFTTEILEGFDVQRTRDLADTAGKYGNLTHAIADYYNMVDCMDKNKKDKACMSYDKFVNKCHDLEKETVSDVFGVQLMQVPQVTEDVALAVLDRYPIVLSLAQVYSHLEGDLNSQEQLLKDIPICNQSKLIGGAISKNIYKFIWGGD